MSWQSLPESVSQTTTDRVDSVHSVSLTSRYTGSKPQSTKCVCVVLPALLSTVMHAMTACWDQRVPLGIMVIIMRNDLDRVV